MSAATLVQTLTELLADCEKEYDEGLDEHTPEVRAVILATVRKARADLATLEARVSDDLLAIAGEKRFVVEGLGEVEIKRRTKRTQWRHDELLPVLIARIMDERETLYDEDGTLLPYVQIGANLTRRLRECVGFGAGKVTGLRPLGLDPSEFCTEEPDGYSVQTPRSAA